MLNYITKRILIFIPTLIVITLLGFIISINAPGDPVERMVTASQNESETGSPTKNQQEQKKYWRTKLGLDLPVFYFSLSSLSQPDTLYKIADKQEKETLDRLIIEYGNWDEIEKYNASLNQFYTLINASFDTTDIKPANQEATDNALSELRTEVFNLKSTHEETAISNRLKNIQLLLSSQAVLLKFQDEFNSVSTNFFYIKENASRWKNYIPTISFYQQNQYHRWLFGDSGKTSRGVIRGDFGISYVTKQPVSDVILSKIGWSMLFSLLSIFMAYMISIPIGIKAAANKGSRFDKTSSLILFILYSVPAFWLATLLLMAFANPDVFHWLPASGVKPTGGYPDNADFFEKIKISLPYIILPLICYTYSSFAFLSRTMRVAMLESLDQDYIRTARAKGLPENKVIWKHALRNSLLPVITIFATVFPAVIGGSVIIETIFTIPGMGSEMIYAIQNNNYPMIIAVLTITGILTLTGYLISDILYAVADPRITYNKP